MATDLRDSGIPAVGLLPWGTHFCHFYETKQDLFCVLVPYFRAGLDGGELCLWITSEFLPKSEAASALASAVPEFDSRIARGDIELLDHDEWFAAGTDTDLANVIARFAEKCRLSLARGYAGMRVNGSTAWLQQKDRAAFFAFERELDRLIENERMIVLCTFPLSEIRGNEVFDAVRTHHYTVAMRHGHVEKIETPELRQARRDNRQLTRAVEALSRPFPGHSLLTGREREVLAQIVIGLTSREAGQRLGISPRTVEFHRTNILQKLGAKNTAELIRIVLDGTANPE